MSFFWKLFGDANKRIVEKLEPQVQAVLAFDQEFSQATDEAIKVRSLELKKKVQAGTLVDDVLPEAFALVREAAKRTIGEKHYPVQVIGGIVLHQGKISEMRTGEGKTLVATLPAYLNALTGKGVHVVTVNDYLARRDAEWMGAVYHFLGLKTSVINHEISFIYSPKEKRETNIGSGEFLTEVTRQEAYVADITYGTNNEFGFDYLRDNMVVEFKDKAQRELNYAIVDEVVSILIDEARTPLIISAPAEEAGEKYFEFARLVIQLEENTDYNIDEKMRAATLTEAGVAKMEKLLGVKNMYEEGGIELVHHLEQALKAKTLFKRDKDYVVKEGEVVIVDEFTGRLMFGRRYSEGLHQAIEAKEGLEIKKESRTLATITFQNYFRLYKKLSGMTGTAASEGEEFHKIYNLDVVVIPTNKPMVRKDHADKIYKTEIAKYKAVVGEVKEAQKRGQPVLVGTISIEKNELLGELLAQEGITHNILNAKNHEKEASFIASAGEKGSVTVATNMAGRGVDIKLGLGVAELGGLIVIGTERHESRRIDNQLRGRAGRQGDPGSSQFFVSLEDDLMRIFGGVRMKGFLERFNWPEDMPIQNRFISKQIEAAQHKVEGHNFDIRKHIVEYDDVMNKHRTIIYKKRSDVIVQKPEELRKTILDLIKEEIVGVVSFHTNIENEREWNLKEIKEVMSTIFPLPKEYNLENFRAENSDKLQDVQSRTKLIDHLSELSVSAFEAWEKKINDQNIAHQISKGLFLRAIDTLWIEHLDQMTYLREGIGLRGYGQRDPLVEYKRESFSIFTSLVQNINKEVVYSIYKIAPVKQIAPSFMQSARRLLSGPNKDSRSEDGSIRSKKVGRNDPCPCGSGKKYKKCHGKNEA